MFKLESYITPVILNYVGKYVKNFKPEQSQVSLWGGDATFQNLDLRLNVLNEQLDLPFTFVSGHIHELLIHVPWVKITSEPIIITINTIECILKMKDGSEKEEDFPSPRPTTDSLQEDTPPGYIRSIVTKVVNNITINCNNLILKFVEEDIVLSVNIRFLSMQTVNNEWQPTFTDVNGNDSMLRKVVTIEDLTLCLDKMDSSGKIDIYQDPVVYRCSMTIRVIMNYQTTSRATITRFDMHSEKMEFSMTEHQIPLLLRLMSMLMALQSKRLVDRRKSSSVEEVEDSGEQTDAVSVVPINNNNGWGTWAWNAVASVLPVEWGDELSPDQQMNYIGHTVHFGIYIQNAILTLKTIETIKESFSHKSMKVRYRPFLTLKLSGVVASAVQQGITVTAYKIGIGSVQLSPRGSCCCGFGEVKASGDLPQYLFAGNATNNYLKDSLFDSGFNLSEIMAKDYSEEIVKRLSSDSAAKEFFQNCPAFILDFVHAVELPEDVKQEELFELARNFEYSNLEERETARLFIGDVKIRVCSGILHRLPVITSAIEKSDILNAIPGKIEPNVNELPPVTVEEYESLNELVPMTETTINVSNLCIQFQLADHRNNHRKIRHSEQSRTLHSKLVDYPRLTLNFDKITGEIVAPMYPFRLAACASKQKELSEKMLSQCYRRINGTLNGFTSQLYLTETSHTSLIMPSNVTLSTQTLIYPQYWVSIESLNIPRELQDCRLDNLSIATTKAKFLVAHSILTSIFYPEIINNPLLCSSLFNDAFNEQNPIYLECSVENVSYSSVTSLGTFTRSLNVGGLRVFALNDVEQAFVFSGPESCDSSVDSNGNNRLLSLSVKYPKNPEESSVIISLKVAETRASLDPLFLIWLEYQSVFYEISNTSTSMMSDNHGTGETSSDTSSRKKTFPSLHENVHSPSEKDRKWNWILENASKKQSHKSEGKSKLAISKKVTNSYFWWKRIGLICSIEPLVVYIPSRTMSGIDMNGIEEAKSHALSSEDQELQIFVMKTAHFTLHSSNFSADQLIRGNFSISGVHQLPNTFPWALGMTEFHCFTLDKRKKLNFVKMESLNATIDATIKQNVNSTVDSSLNTLGFCIYVDTSPIVVSCCEEQIKMITRISNRLSRIVELNLNVQQKPQESIDVSSISQSQPLQSPQILCTEETDTISTTSTSKNESEVEENPVVMTAWIQWTITKVEIKLYAFHAVTHLERKMVIKLEDIITSLDWQPIYIQLKNKVTTATIFHYLRSMDDRWRLGEFSGIVMCLGEQDDLVKGIEADDFLTITVTRAKLNNVYNKWSSYHKSHQKSHKEHFAFIDDSYTSNYITEVIIKLQVLEVILPMEVLKEYLNILNTSGCDNGNSAQATSVGNSRQLPLIYADFKGVTLVFPLPIRRNELQHDTIVVRTEGIQMNPHAENPICRVILRPDIYELAAQANILNTPGSAVEDRQYEIKINDVLAYSTSWIHRQVNLTKRNAQASLYTMNENPALEWNNMNESCDDGEGAQCLWLTTAFDVCCIIAPPIMYKSETVVCGKAVEVTCLTDIEIGVNLDQIKLLTILSGQMTNLVASDADDQGKDEVSQELMENQREFGQDSGVDVDMSSTDVGGHLASPEAKHPSLPPFEYLMNFGKISVIIYESSRTRSSSLNIAPLIYVLVNQPNTYISQQNFTRTFQINCFDVSVSFPDEENKKRDCVPVAGDFKESLIETKNGDPHPHTGIPPSFVIIKYQTTFNRRFVNIDLGRPTRVNLSLGLIDSVLSAGKKLTNCLNSAKSMINRSEDHQEEVGKQETYLTNLPDLSITTKQIVLAFKSDSSSELIVSLSSMSSGLRSKPRKLRGNVNLTSAMITTNVHGNFRALLNPMSCNLFIAVTWESWHDVQDTPQTRIQGHGDSVFIDIGPEQLRVLKDIQKSVETLSDRFLTNGEQKSSPESVRKTSNAAEQHYRDDLKVGAFQFMDGNADDMPLPYQVIFSKYPNQSMVWRYPQPRILTRLHVNPQLSTMIEDTELEIEGILCVIEFWSESLNSYQRYIEFPMLEMRKPTFKLPNKFPTRAVACIWRFTLHSTGDLDSRTLAGYLRIDSYFNSSLISGIEMTVSVKSLDVSFYNHIVTSTQQRLSPSLGSYEVTNVVPTTQCFAMIKLRNLVVVFNNWEESMLVDFSGSVSVQIMDYAYLRMRNFLEEVSGKVQLSKSDHLSVVMMWQDVWLKFGPEVSHTLTMSYNLWSSALDTDNLQENPGVVLSRIVVANNCNLPIRFGQSQSPDDILLQTSECHSYTWCHSENQSMRVAMKNTGWIWSKSFNVKTDGVKPIVFDRKLNSGIHANITSISPTQKLITIYGQLIIANTLDEVFELRLLKYNDSSKTKKIVAEDVAYLAKGTKPQSMVIDERDNFAMRLRFFHSTNCQWTGDIPLHANAKCDQPWLVKVPHQGKDKFLSIWVRIVQDTNDCGRILVILSPLYMVRSFLPIDVGVKVDTPTLATSFDTKLQGRGDLQQLNCPGTFENYHQLTFHSVHEISTLQTSIPVSYNCVDQRTFFKRPQKEDLDEILQNLYKKREKPEWPFKDDDENPWKPVKQGKTQAFIRYQDAGLVSSTLLFEIRPWCFVMNASGQSVSIISNDDLLCEIPHLGVCSPPKLDGIFHLQVDVDDQVFTSTPLQLANSEWNRGFIMPQISGLIPVDGTTKVTINCESQGTCSLFISSSVQDEIRVIRITSSHVFCNFTEYELQVATVSANILSSTVDLPEELSSISSSPAVLQERKEGIPITRWLPVLNSFNTGKTHEAPFVVLNAGSGWSCPSKVDQPISRNCLSIPHDRTSIPIVITTQKDKDVTYIVASLDDYPQLVIKNSCSFDLIIRQSNSSKSGLDWDAAPFSWVCEVPSGHTRHYTTPNVGRLIPDAANVKEPKSFVYITSKDEDWFKVIELPVEKPIRFDQYVQIDANRDIKIMVESRGHSVHINVEPKSQIEVSVRDIRSRLVLEEICAKLPDQMRQRSLSEDSERMESPVSVTDAVFDDSVTLKNKEDEEEQLFTFYVKGINLVLSQDSVESQKVEVASFYFMHTIVNITSTIKSLSLGVTIGDLQFDNQMFDQGGFDFPVVLISQKPTIKLERSITLASSLENCLIELRKGSLFTIECLWEKIDVKYACKSAHVRISPINIYIEDKYVTQLLEYATSMVRPCFIMSNDQKEVTLVTNSNNVNIPANITMDARIMSSPLRIQSLSIEPISILLSVHTSVRLYVALDHSPLHFGVFERQNLFTTPYRLGNALTMHYLSGAIFGAGWVVGSLEILGSPGSFAQALGSGLKDFIALPFQGLLQGPWGFIVGITHGSASLMKNITAGTVNSVTKLASSVARNLDRLTLDEEHVQRQEESRRTRPQGMAEGLYQGLTGFGISILAAVAGIAHHPLQNLLNGDPSAKGLVTGVGLGLVGVVTKPLSGAAELVALTGQGLLQRTGWNSLPSARRKSISGQSSDDAFCTRYIWKLASLMLKNCDNVLYLTDAEFVDSKGNKCPVTLVVTRHDFLVMNKLEDKVYKLFGLKELSVEESGDEEEVLRVFYSVGQQQRVQSETPSERLEMDQEMRSRVEQYVISSSGMVSLGENEGQGCVVQGCYSSSISVNSLNFFMEPKARRYVRDLMRICRRQSQGIDFTVL